jgi:uncharacterized C2H2 Zn-finger protein
MNSISNQTLVHCPQGCEPFEADYFCLIRADENPELKEAILGGELHLVRCPECGTFFHHEKELMYLDPENELLVFMFPQDSKDRENELRKRMQDDYRSVRDVLFKDLNMDYPPVCVFGLEELKHLLESEEIVNIESQAVAAASAEQGFEVARLKPSYARAHHFPHYIPVLPHTKKPQDYAVAAAKVLKSGLHSPLLLNLKDHMSQEEAVEPHLYERVNR